MIPLIYFGLRDTPINVKLILKTIAGPLITVVFASLTTYLFIINYSQQEKLEHLLILLIFFGIYFTLTMLRPNTRETLKLIIESILTKKRE